MKYIPKDPVLSKHIDHYWIVRDAQPLFANAPLLHAYPGVTPELTLVLRGHYRFRYLNRWHRIDQSGLFSFIHENIILDPSSLASFIIIQFKSRALSSLLPFVKQTATQIMRSSVCDAREVFGKQVHYLVDHFNGLSDEAIVDELDNWLRSFYRSDKDGFLSELANDLQDHSSLNEIQKLTSYSYSTLERHFKRDTGLTPKQYQLLWRYKKAVKEIYETRNADWGHYVYKYGYFDQSHFIKNIKRFTSFTPKQLLATPGVLSFRSENL